jgi:hypothetical protein
MASFNAKLDVDGTKYSVAHLSYSANRALDYEGRPASKIKDSIIEMEVEIPEGDVMFFKWLCYSEIKAGSIHFDKPDMESKLIEIKFENAFCISYKTVFNPNAGVQSAFTVEVKLSAGKLTMTSGSQEFEHSFFANA